MEIANIHRDGKALRTWLFFVLGIVTRIPFTSDMLLNMDACQFVLALDRFDIAVHHPHPPGYFIYVLMGRLLKLFIADGNAIFVSISVLFSGLTIAAVYLLGEEIFDRNIGTAAAMLALTSPSLWFHGEVALTYIVEAFLCTAIAFFCWKILNGEGRYLLASAVLLGLSGGIRQTTPVFLFPLWLFSVKGQPVKKIAAALGMLATTSLLWFLPMVGMTGGWNAYRTAVDELWTFHTGGNSAFERGSGTLALYFLTLVRYLVYGIGLGVFPLGLVAYSFARRGKFALLDKEKVSFFAMWCVPVLLFYLFIFISIQNPGYSFLFLPAFFLLTAASLESLGNSARTYFPLSFRAILLSALVLINMCAFLFVKSPVSFPWIREHDAHLAVLLNEIRKDDPGRTGVFVNNYVYYSYRHVMVYLPEYHAYNVDARVDQAGNVRKTFHGIHGETMLSDGFPVPETIDRFLAPLLAGDEKFVIGDVYDGRGIAVWDLTPDIRIVCGPISMLGDVFPEVVSRTMNDDRE